MRNKQVYSALLSFTLLLTLSVPAAAYDGGGAGMAQSLSGGASESFLIDSSGTLWAWGANEWGQLGDGSTQDQSAPVRVMEGVSAVSAGESHTYAILEDGSLWVWGRNVSSAFPGSPELVSSAEPVKVMDNAAAVSTGVCTHLAVTSDGSLLAWGKYIGDRSNRQCETPKKILDRVTAVSTGFGHSLALRADGSLWAWGQNVEGAVGDGTTRERVSPVKVLDNVVQISAGYGFSAAVKKDGTLWTWGRNWQGELGDGTTTSRSTPAQIMDRVVSVHASNNNAYALREDGSVWAWGNNRAGEVGDGTSIDRLSPVRVLDGVAQLAVGWDHVLARKTDGTLWTWGTNVSGQLGNGESGLHPDYVPQFRARPVQVMEQLESAARPVAQPGGSQPSSWAQETVTDAIWEGFVPGLLRHSYTRPITRVEFCTLAVQFYEVLTGSEAEGRVTFTDTDNINVEKAAALGIVSGVGEGLFAPDAPLNRQQAAVMLANLAQALGAPLPQSPPDFSDSASISGWARSAVGQVQHSGIMSGGGGGAFAPTLDFTREQSILTVMNLFRLLSKS